MNLRFTILRKRVDVALEIFQKFILEKDLFGIR